MHDPSEHTADVLGLDPRYYTHRISVDLDIELVECLDARRGGASHSDYVERVLFATMERLLPHLPGDWRSVHVDRHAHLGGRDD